MVVAGESGLPDRAVDHHLAGQKAPYGGPVARAGRKRYRVAAFEWRRANPAIPFPDGYPDRARWCAAMLRLPLDTGAGEVDWTLVALQNAAAASAGPGTWPLVGMALSGTGWRTPRCRTWPRPIALASRAVSDRSPKADSIIFSVEVCSNGPAWATVGAARLDTTMVGTRNPSCR